MSDSADPALRRARQELAAALLLADNGFTAQAVSRAYYAAFYAGEAALSSIDETRSKHAGVVAAVATLLVREHGLDPEAARLLRSLFERRSRADYELDTVPTDEGPRAVTDATSVVDAIADWMAP